MLLYSTNVNVFFHTTTSFFGCVCMAFVLDYLS